MKILHSNILGTQGRPMIILHGFLGMSDNWKSLGNDYAAEGYQVHLVDQRNHGRSFHDPEFSYTAMAEDLKRYMDHHSISEAVIIGHSMGGKTAMFFATTYPERVSKLIVADIAPRYYPPHHQDILNALQKMDLSKVQERSDADAQLAAHLKSRAIRQFLLKNLYRKDEASYGFRFNLEVLVHAQEQVGEQLSPSHTFTKPTLFLRGSLSDYITDTDEPLLRKHFPEAQIQTIEKAGHWLHAEQPKAFFEVSTAFLQR